MLDRLLGAYKKQAARERATVQILVNAAAQPLNKLEGIVQMIGMFQEQNPAATQIILPGSGIKVPQEVIDQLIDRWEYTCTSSATTAPPGMPFVSTWRLLSVVAWGAGDSEREKTAIANLPRTNTTTFAIDPTLFMLIRANTTYKLSAGIYFSNTVAAPGFKWRLSGPNIGTGIINVKAEQMGTGLTTQTFLNISAFNGSNAVTSASVGNGNVQLDGIIQNGANAGVLSIDWAQNALNGANTIRQAGSWLKLIEI